MLLEQPSGFRRPPSPAAQQIDGSAQLQQRIRRRVDAVDAASLVGAKTVIPCHYNTFPPIETDVQAFKSDVESATGSSVVVLEPGETHST